MLYIVMVVMFVFLVEVLIGLINRRRKVSSVSKHVQPVNNVEHPEPVVPRNTRRGAFGLPFKKPEFNFNFPIGNRRIMSHEERRLIRRNRKNHRRAKASR